MTKWRQRQRAIEVAVIRDGLEDCGLYPFRRYDFLEVAYLKRIEAARSSGSLNEMFKAIYSKPIKFLLSDPYFPAYQHMRIGR